MIDEPHITVSRAGGELAVGHGRCVGGPDHLTWRGQPLLTTVRTTLGGVGDGRLPAARQRCQHRGGVHVVLSVGRAGIGPRLRQTCRYGPRFARFTTDLNLPRDSAWKQPAMVGSCTLPGPWEQFQELRATATGLELSTPRPLPGPDDPAEWTDWPLALLFAAADGRRLEIGSGADLWRWRYGFGPGAGAPRLRLSASGDGWQLDRILADPAEVFSPEPRPYRFSWYAAWDAPGDRIAAPPGDRFRAPVAADGDLDLDALRGALAANPELVLELPVRDWAWPATLCRRLGDQASPAPCLAASAAATRLRRIVRQLVALPARPPIIWSGLEPGGCEVGRHVDRKKPRPHWDVNALLEFGLWARRALGDRPMLAVGDGPDTPARGQCFASDPEVGDEF